MSVEERLLRRLLNFSNFWQLGHNAQNQTLFSIEVEQMPLHEDEIALMARLTEIHEDAGT